MYGIFFYRVCLVYTCVLLFLPPVILEKQTQTFCTRAQHYDKYQLNTRAKSKLCPPLHYTFACLPLWNGLLWACSRVLITSRGVTKMKQKSFRNTLDALKMLKFTDILSLILQPSFFFLFPERGKKNLTVFTMLSGREKRMLADNII